MAINPSLLANIFTPLIRQALTQKGQIGMPDEYIQKYITDRNYDPYLMLESARSEDTSDGYFDDFFGTSKIAPTTQIFGADGLYAPELDASKTLKVLNNGSPNDLQKLYEHANEAPAYLSALNMLAENPDIGLEDPKKKLFKKLINTNIKAL